MKVWKVVIVVIVALLAVGALGRFLLSRFFAEDKETAWTYRSPKYGFSLTIPSSDWKEIKREGDVAAFYNRKRQTLASAQVTKESRQEFITETVPAIKGILERHRAEILKEPHCSEGTTAAGNPFVFWIAVTRAPDGKTVVAAHSAVWCPAQGITVRVLMEGLLEMQSEAGKAEEWAFFEKSAKTLCLSVQ